MKKNVIFINSKLFNTSLLVAGILLLMSSCHSLKQTKSSGSTYGSFRLTVVDSSIVFEPDTAKSEIQNGGYASMRIPALVRTPKGTLLAFCEGRVGTASDWTDMDLLLRRSTDGGKSWQHQQVVAKRQKGPTSNATPIVSSDGTIHLLYQRDYARAYYTRSTDEGKSWLEPVDITPVVDQFKKDYSWNVLAPGPGHALQLENGRLLAPIWLANSPVTGAKRKHSPSVVATIYSDDLGRSWKAGSIAAYNTPELTNPNESALTQLNDGRVMINIRSGSKAHLRAISISPDGISNWSKPVFDTALFDPICMAGLIKLPLKATAAKKGKEKRTTVLAFSNPDSRDIPKHPRRNLTLKISPDEGQSWPVSMVINKGAAGYSDLAVENNGKKTGFIYCLYETNTVGQGWNYSLVLKKIKWIRK